MHPEITLEQVPWAELYTPETFSVSRCQLLGRGHPFVEWVYYPHPETDPLHFQLPDRLGVLMPKMAGIQCGDRLRLLVRTDEICIQ